MIQRHTQYNVNRDALAHESELSAASRIRPPDIYTIISILANELNMKSNFDIYRVSIRAFPLARTPLLFCLSHDMRS